MSELTRRIEALRRPLLFVSQSGFANLDKVRDLGETLRRACDRIVEVAADEEAAPFISWRGSLAQFERADRNQQAVAVARGLRLCQTLAGRPPAKKARTPRRGPKGDPSLGAPTTTLPGIGPSKATSLAERGIETVEDLAWLVPRRYDDVRVVSPLAAALARGQVGERVTARGSATSCRFFRKGRTRWVDLRLDDPDDRSCRLIVRWFNAHPPMAKRFPAGSMVVLSGKLSQRGGAYEMANPDVLSVTLPDGQVRRGTAEEIIPRYPDVPGVPPATLRKACRAAAEAVAGDLVDGVPAAITRRLGMVTLAEAIRTLHAPPADLEPAEVETLDAGTSQWHRRLAFDELFVLGLAIARRRAQRRSDRAVPCPRRVPLAELEACFGFSLTGAQRRASADIARDLAGAVPMNRLLQGDVGSGKTAVAYAAAEQVICSGRQVALMAPTAILAEQHATTLGRWAKARGKRVALLTAATPKGVRASLLSMLEAGQIDLLIGTHSLISDGVGFASLGLVIIDEQHRFGVAQRVRLRSKGQADGGAPTEDGAPHLLVMTATPIPRTLALTAYGDLDVSTLDEMPPGRTPPVTRVLSGKRGRQRACALIRKHAAAGQRAFVVCPLVEPSPDDEVRRDWAAATSTAEVLAADLGPDIRVGLVHGRMPTDERDRAMARLREGELDVLVSTTVIEVGVDVPEATVMVIEDAHHFGLSQLHQLRGRVGRGGGASHCLLLTRGRKTDDGARRLAVMVKTTDGFRIAEEDLAIRGPGELFGARQAGLPKLRFGDLSEHTELLLLARQEADRLLADDPRLERPEHEGVRRVLEARAGVEIYGAEGG